MRMAYGEGVVVAILLPFVLFFLGVVSLSVTLFLCLIFLGVWTLISAFLLARKVERNFFLTWGLILSCASTIFVIQLSYAIALILIAYNRLSLHLRLGQKNQRINSYSNQAVMIIAGYNGGIV